MTAPDTLSDTLMIVAKSAAHRIDMSILLLAGAVFLCALSTAFLVFTRKPPDGPYTELEDAMSERKK